MACLELVGLVGIRTKTRFLLTVMMFGKKYVEKNKEPSGYRYKTLLYWDSVSLVYGEDQATGEAARTASESSREMGREESSTREPNASATSLKRQRSDDSFTSMLAENKFTEVMKDDKPPKLPSSKEVWEALDEIEGLDDATLLKLYDILTPDARKFESLLALPMARRKTWLLMQLNN